MLNVLVVVDHAVGISGPHRNVVGSLNALAARDDVSLRLLCGRIDECESYAKSGRVDIRTGFHPHRPGAFWNNIRKLRESAKGVDVIYCPTGLKTFLYTQAIRAGRRLVAGPNVTPLPIRRADSPGRIEVGLLCDRWLEASLARFHHVVRYTGSRKIRLVPHGLDTNRFSPDRRDPGVWLKYGIREDSVKVLFVGKDAKRLKGVQELLEAIEIFNRFHVGPAVDFVLVGRMSSATERRAATAPNVHLLGFRAGEELAAIYAGSDLSVVPSTWEAFGFVVLESMASGLAVIASNTGGIRDQIVDGVSGVLVDIVDRGVKAHRPDAAKTIALAIRALVDDPEQRKRLGMNARRRVEGCFSERALGERLVAVFQECYQIGAESIVL